MHRPANATTTKNTFSRITTVQVAINADASDVWKLLTDAADFPRWNSTVLSMEGNIKEGEKIRLKSYLDPKRTFKLTVKEVIPQKRLVWGDAMGTRVQTLEKSPEGKLTFSMTEKIGNLLFPLFASQIPSFDEAFEKYAHDLKSEAERITNAK